MNYLDLNLTVLEPRQPQLAPYLKSVEPDNQYQLLPSRSRIPTLKINEVFIHSAYNPLSEAKQLAEKLDAPPDATILLNGFGLGYLAEALVSKGYKLIVAEADPKILKMALEARDLTALLKKVLIYSGSESIPFKEFLRQWGIENQLTVFNHHPSVKLNPQFYDSLQSTAKSNYSNNEAVQPQGLKILLPSPLYGGSLPVAHYCNDALTALGHKVEFFDANFYYPAYRSIDSITANESHQGKLRGLFTMFVSEMVLAKALEFKPDLVLGVAQSPFTTETLTEFKQMKLPVAFWFVEDFRLFKYWKTFAPLYDYFFVIQKGEFTQLLNQSGVKHHHYLPLAADPQIHRPLDLTADELKEFASDLSFVGAGYYNRHQFFLQLLNEDFKIWGTEWNKNSPLGRVLQRNGQRISTSDCVKIFNATKINLNLHSSSYHTGVNPAGDFLNPRTYEIAACGAFQLVDYRSDLPDMFEIDLEIVAFSDINQLRNKMKYYLTHPEERSAIAEAGRNRVLKQHTYQHRMQELLTIVAENEPRLQTRRENPNLARNLLRASDNDPELKAIFQRFQPDEELNIDKIAANIRKGKGSLTQAEGVFLLMKEFYDWAREKKVI